MSIINYGDSTSIIEITPLSLTATAARQSFNGNTVTISSKTTFEPTFHYGIVAGDVTSTFYSGREQDLHKLNFVRGFITGPLSPAVRQRMIDTVLVDETLRVLLALTIFLPARSILLRENLNDESNHELEVWVQGREDIEAEMDDLDRFDKDWFIHQALKLRQGIVVFVE